MNIRCRLEGVGRLREDGVGVGVAGRKGGLTWGGMGGRTKKCHKKEMRGEAASGRGYLPLANNTNTATASQ